jgi:hypothetical protein
MIAPAEDKENLFFACALSGTDSLESTKFRTTGVKDGFRVSYDDYMRDTNGDGRDDYCRILKWKDSYQPVCQRALDFGFDSKELVDSEPPEEIATLLTFYEGAVVWLRMFGNLKDTVESVKVQTVGKMIVDERPRRTETDGVEFDGSQYMRISDSSDLSLGMVVPLRSVRTWMVWAKFDEFTNNAKIFDFGNGKANGNVFLGILGKGDPGVDTNELRSSCDTPLTPSGQQPVVEMSPQRLMETTDANVNEWKCTGFEMEPRRLSPSVPTAVNTATNTEKATLLYEVWDQQTRKMSLNVFTKRRR